MKEKLESDQDYQNFPDDGIETQLTWRSIIVGCFLGCIVSASNMYMGLKMGWTFPAAVIGSIFGYGIIKAMSPLPTWLGGGPLGMRENCMVVTCASAAGGLGVGFVAGIPAMFRLNLLPPLKECWGLFFLWSLAAGFYGMFFAVPLRSYFILQQKLVFPSATAAAMAVRNLHSQEKQEKYLSQTRWMLITFAASILFKTCSFFLPTLSRWHIFYGLGQVSGWEVFTTIDQSWFWSIQWSPAFLGVGMITGLNSSLSFVGGTILAWGIIGPNLFYNKTDIVQTSIHGTSEAGATVQYWNMWVGITIMIVASGVELLCRFATVKNSITGAGRQILNIIKKLRGKPVDPILNNEPVPRDQQVPLWMWLTGLIFSSILTLIILHFYFQMHMGMGLLASILGFTLAFIGCQSTGEIDINPIGMIAKLSQLIFAFIPAATKADFQRYSLVAALVTSSCASQAVDMVVDLKVGYLLRSSPKSQFYAQIIGSFCGIIISIVTFMLFATAYPCILESPGSKQLCEFAAPAVTAWAGLTEALTGDVMKLIPTSCQIACLVVTIIIITSTLLKHTILPKLSTPNWHAVGIAFVNIDPSLPVACLFGSIIALSVNRYRPRFWSIVGISIASGLIAGEGMGGILSAFLNLIVPASYKSGFLCPNQNPRGC